VAFDGIMVHGILKELRNALLDGYIQKIQQPEKEELMITVKMQRSMQKLLISANASLPLIYLTEDSKPSPLTAPNFCMLLRKHIGSAHIVDITQPGLERILDFKLEHYDELGDLCVKHLIIELMGKYSNIIFTNDEMMILDAIKHVPPTVSSMRTVLPGHPYFVPEMQEKTDALTVSKEDFYVSLTDTDTLSDAIYKHFAGFSTQATHEFLHQYGFSTETFVSALDNSEKNRFADCFLDYVDRLKNGDFSFQIAYEGELPVSFNACGLPSYASAPETYAVRTFDSASELLQTYFSERNQQTNMKQRSADLKKVADNLLERAVKKEALQSKQLKDAEKRETYKLYGELLNAYSYTLPVGNKTVSCLNYYNNEEITIPVDPDLSIKDNAKRYFEKYGKQKRTYEALIDQIQLTRDEIEHLSSIVLSIEQCPDIQGLKEIRKEMELAGYVKRSVQNKDRQTNLKSKPYHYVSSDGYHIYVGKNNIQNDTLTFKFAEGNDLWFHAKQMPGSHVIVKTNGETEVPDRLYEEAAALAAYYSSGRENPKCEIDYVRKKEVKKPAGAKPGFVVYYTNYSMVVTPSASGLTLVE